MATRYRLSFLYKTLLILGLTTTILFAWTGSDPIVEISFPTDGSTISAPFSLFGNCYNSLQGIDYYQLEYWADTNSNGEADVGDGSAWTLIRKQPNYNFNYAGARLTTRYECTDTIFTDGDFFLIRIWGMDLSGDTSSDTTVDYMTGGGDGNTWLDREVCNFQISGERP